MVQSLAKLKEQLVSPTNLFQNYVELSDGTEVGIFSGGLELDSERLSVEATKELLEYLELARQHGVI